MTKRVLITGGAGFVAHHVVDYFLKNTDYEIISLDRLDFSGDLNRLQEISREYDTDTRKRLKIVYHDLKSELNDYVKSRIGPINIILHMAASSHVSRSIKFPLEFVYDNMVGSANILEYARTNPDLEKMIYFSTDEVFGPSIGEYKFKEFDRYNSSNPYSATKAGAEELFVAYKNTYNLPICITHTMNIFGERQNPEKYIPMIIKKILNKEKIKIHYDSKTNQIGSRTYIHALDVADALYFILNLKEIKFPENHMGGVCPKFNVTSDEEYDNLEIAKMVAKAMGVELDYELVDANIDRPGHDFRYLISGEYLKSLGWKKKISVESGIKSLVDYTLKNMQG